MKKSIEILNRASAHHGQKAIAKLLGISEEAICNAKRRGRVSPRVAAACAKLEGEDVYKWAGIAALENISESFKNLLSLAKPYGVLLSGA